MKYADLHVHTFYSDSTFSPDEVLAHADKVGLAGIAICDHDSVDGLQPALEAARQYGIEIIPGIEITVEKADAEMHILGYFMDWNDRWFRDRLKEIQALRLERIHAMVDKLIEAGFRMSIDDVKSVAGKGTVGRLHVAQAMLKTGKVGSIRECFEKYIGFLKPCYVSNIRFSPRESIELVLKAGGVPVLAHPDVSGADDYIPELIEYGLRGIEAYHTEHKAHAVKRYESMAKRCGLVVTGGSDCHGLGKGRVLLGGVRVPYTVVEKLRQVADDIKKKR